MPIYIFILCADIILCVDKFYAERNGNVEKIKLAKQYGKWEWPKCFLISYYGFMVAKLKKIFETIKQKYTKTFAVLKNMSYLCTRNAQMAESVDALVSNTSGAIRPGSTPGLGTSIKVLCACK